MGASAAAVVWGVIEAIPAIRDIFFKVLDLHYSKLSKNLHDGIIETVDKRRAISNAIENAKTKDDLRMLSIMLHDFNVELSNGHRKSIRKTRDTK